MHIWTITAWKKNLQNDTLRRTAKGTITFLSPEAYLHCLWIGKKINIQEGARIVGYATIAEIFNPLLRFDEKT